MEKFSNKANSKIESVIPEAFDPLAGPDELTRRSLLRGALASLGLSLIPNTSIARIEMEDNIKSIELPESFLDRYNAARQLRVQLRADQVMATTTRGELIAGPIDLEPALGWQVADMISATERNGGEVQGIPGAYLEDIRERIRAGNNSEPDELVIIEHVYLSLQNSSDVSETILSRVQGKMNSFPAGENMTYTELIERFFNPDFDAGESGEFLANELKKILPALIAKESMFSPTAISSAGARAELQILPGTFEKYAGTEANPQNFRAQLEVASQYFEASYRYLTTNLRNQLDVIYHTYFNNDEITFTEYFLLPLLINAYNAGDGNMREVVDWFINTYSNPEELAVTFGAEIPLVEEDIYFIMATLVREEQVVGDYRQQASTYALDIMATAPVFNGSLDEDVRLAANIN